MSIRSDRARRRALTRGLSMLVALALFGAIGPVSSSLAVVQIDPQGPAGQQYALPLDTARGQGAGDPSVGVPGSKETAPLFGQGIQPAADAEQPQSEPGTNQDGQGQSNPKPDRNGTEPNRGDSVEQIRQVPQATTSGDSKTTQLLALIAGLVVVGGGGGLLMRRRLSPA